MKSINSIGILVAVLCAIILIGIAGCGGETETIVKITEPINNTSTQQNTVHILGKVENTDTTMAQVTVNDKEQQANIANGSFDVIITLIDGNNIIKVSVDGVSAQVNITKIKQTTGNEIIGKDGAPMLPIPAGDFQMGDAFNEGESDERPVHTVYIDAFYMDVYEVTNAQYKKFMDATGYKAPDYWDDPDYNALDYPVVGVSWLDAVAYAEWAGKKLPTEAEWEKAARGGLVAKRYPLGDDISHDNANYGAKAGKDVWAFTSPVGSFAPNGYGLYDMAGNVFEWCADWYDGKYYANSPKSNPTGPSSGQSRISRGGGWYGSSDFLRVSRHNYDNPTQTRDYLGFRCAGLQ
jgi:formylglycine-generating enzyme